MIRLFVILLLGSSALCAPAWMYSRRRRDESAWLLFLPAPAILVWVILTGLGVGAQSLSNLVEAVALAGGGVLLCYVKVFLVDRSARNARGTTLGMLLLLIIAAVLARLFMPLLPE